MSKSIIETFKENVKELLHPNRYVVEFPESWDIEPINNMAISSISGLTIDNKQNGVVEFKILMTSGLSKIFSKISKVIDRPKYDDYYDIFTKRCIYQNTDNIKIHMLDSNYNSVMSFEFMVKEITMEFPNLSQQHYKIIPFGKLLIKHNGIRVH
jgi:hypothetical protein